MIRYIEQKEFDRDLCDEYETRNGWPNNPSKILGEYFSGEQVGLYLLKELLDLEMITSRELYLSGLNGESILFTKVIDEFIIYHGERYLKDFPYEINKKKIRYISDAINRKKNHEDIYSLYKWYIRNMGSARPILNHLVDLDLYVSDHTEPIPELFGSGLVTINKIQCAMDHNIECEELNRIKRIFMNTVNEDFGWWMGMDEKVHLRDIKTDCKRENERKVRERSDYIQIGQLHAKVPKDWEKEQPNGSMRMAQFRVPGNGGDGELVIFSGRGSIDANLKGLYGQFKSETENSVSESAIRSNSQIKDMDVTYSYVEGTYLKMGGGWTKTEMPNYALLVAIVATPDGLYWFKLTGPKSTLDSQKVNFETFIRSIELL
jgi:hypothetical protein